MHLPLHRIAVLALCGIGCSVLLAYFLAERQPLPIANFMNGAEIDPAVRAILERSCADCHSNSTRYPRYSSLPWVSRMIEEDVARGREQLDLTRWHEYSRLRRMRALTGIANQVKDRAMPLREYMWLHPWAKLTDDEVNAVFQWADKERLRLIMEGAK